MYKFETQQFLPGCTLDEVFDFFSDEKNLETITPPWLGFRVTGKSTDAIEEGTKLNYRLRIHGVPCNWETLIEEWEPGVMFSDRQLKGPYNYWKHFHLFRQEGDGVQMEDKIQYRLPLGWLGHLVAGRFVRNDITKIFQYRRDKISEIFGEKHE